MQARILFLFAFLIVLSCSPQVKSTNKDCGTIEKKVTQLFYEYELTSDTAYLDSVWLYSNIAFTECKDSIFILKSKFWKLNVLQFKHKYFAAANYIDSIPINEIMRLPFYKDFLKYRFEAMGYNYKGDIIHRDSCLIMIDTMLSNFLDSHKKEIYSLLKERTVEQLFQEPLFRAFIAYYENRKFLYSCEKAKAELDSLYKILKLNNEEFYYTWIETFCYNTDFYNFSLL